MEKSQFDRNIVSDNLYGKYHSYYWDEEEKLLNLVNDARRKAGARELKYDADLNALCEVKMLEKSIYGLDTFTKQIPVSYTHLDVYKRQNGVNAIAHSCNDYRLPGKNDDISFVVNRLDQENGVAVGIITRIIRQNI